MNKLQELIGKCKCSVTVTVNDHKDCYESVFDSLLSDRSLPNKKWQDENGCDLTDDLLAEIEVEPDVLKGTIDRDTIVRVQFYPDTPNGSYTIYHYDLDKALDEALKVFS